MNVYFSVNNQNEVNGFSLKPVFPNEYEFTELEFDEFKENFYIYSYANGQLTINHVLINEINVEIINKKLSYIRKTRSKYLNAFDTLEAKRNLYNQPDFIPSRQLHFDIQSITETKWTEIVNWIEQWLAITDNVTVDTNEQTLMQPLIDSIPIEIAWFM